MQQSETVKSEVAIIQCQATLGAWKDQAGDNAKDANKRVNVGLDCRPDSRLADASMC